MKVELMCFRFQLSNSCPTSSTILCDFANFVSRTLDVYKVIVRLDKMDKKGHFGQKETRVESYLWLVFDQKSDSK